MEIFEWLLILPVGAVALTAIRLMRNDRRFTRER
jgi:hypothetical protein